MFMIQPNQIERQAGNPLISILKSLFMKTLLFIRIGFLVSMVSSVCAQTGGQVLQEGGIIGTWVNNDYGYAIAISFKPDGNGDINGDRFTYTLLDNRLSTTAYGRTIDYTYQLENNKLTIAGGDLPATVTFVRTDAAADQQAIGRTDDEALIGIWSGNGEQIEFHNGGRCTYLGETFSYTAENGQMLVITGEGNISFNYSINGDELTISANGQHVVYKKGAGHNPVSSSINSHTGGHGVAQELVGQWCWIDVTNYNEGASMSSRCITLNADGTYVYNSEASRSVNTPDIYGGTTTVDYDRGTWYLEGDRLYYTSETRGQGSYKLEKRNHPKNISDPMIILNGEAFVTSTQKPPWK